VADGGDEVVLDLVEVLEAGDDLPLAAQCVDQDLLAWSTSASNIVRSGPREK